VNDLDLELRDESSGIHLGFGNGRQARDSSNGWHAVRDSANNVEKVVLDAAAPGRYALIIEARKVPEGTQAFALAISGNFTSAEACTGLLPSCGMGCGEQGECVSGRCSCPLSRRGERCELSNPSLELDAPDGPLEQACRIRDHLRKPATALQTCLRPLRAPALELLTFRGTESRSCPPTTGRSSFFRLLLGNTSWQSRHWTLQLTQITTYAGTRFHLFRNSISGMPQHPCENASAARPQ